MAIFEVSEMLKVAIVDEEAGIKFYEILAGKVKNSTLKERLMSIANQEKIHMAIFQQMLKEVKDVKIREEYKGQHENYMKALMNSRAFPDTNLAIKKANSASSSECLDIALRLEKDAILFYEELMKFVPNTYAKQVGEVMEEERNHLTELLELKANF